MLFKFPEPPLSFVVRMALSHIRGFLADAGLMEPTKNPEAMISALRKIEGHGELPNVTSAVMEMCIDNRREGFADLFVTHPSADRCVDVLVRYVGGHDFGRRCQRQRRVPGTCPPLNLSRDLGPLLHDGGHAAPVASPNSAAGVSPAHARKPDPMTASFLAAALEPEATGPLVLALPKGRILSEAAILLRKAGIEPSPDYADEDSRRLRFPTNDPNLDVVRVRPFDVATFVAFGAAQIGICGADVLMEFDYPEIYAPLDLSIGACRVAIAEPAATAGSDDPSRWSRVRVATKYPNIARRHFAAQGVHADVVELSGAMELAPGLGLSRLIVDLVQTGSTLKANGLVETAVIAQVTSRLIVNRTALKTKPEAIGAWIARFRAALAG